MRRIGYVAIGWAVLAAGCHSTYSQRNLTEPSAKLVGGKSVVIATPANGVYSKREYTGSGEMTALAVRDAFTRLTDAVTVSAGKDLNALKGDGSAHFDYYVVPEILHWEERATEWFGFPDRVHLKLTVYDGTTWDEIVSTSIYGTSKRATFGGVHPQDLLPDPINRWVESLY
jgi:hypothetical protein